MPSWALNVAHLDCDDMLQFNEVFGSWPWELCSRHWKPVTRRRWWWLDFAPSFPEGTRLERTQSGATRIIPVAERTPLEAIVEPGWWPVALLLKSATEENFNFRCLTRRVPFDKQPRAPRGLHVTSESGKRRWRDNDFDQSPYQFDDSNCVQSLTTGKRRRLTALEEECLSAYPEHYTAPVCRLSIRRC